MKFFKNVQTLEELKKQYKMLARKHHPDLGGSVEDMQAINDEYDRLFKRYANIHETMDGRIYEDAEHKEVNEAPVEFRNIISELIIYDDITVELVGRWMWVTGNTFACKDKLKSLGFMWASKKKAWYWHNAKDVCKSRKGSSLDEIKFKYGCSTFSSSSSSNAKCIE